MLNPNKPTIRELLARAASESPVTFDIVRHGATAFNGESGVSVDKERGWSNVPLTLEGRKQALAAGVRLKGRGIGAIVSSDLNRAIETAQIIGEVLGIKPQYSFRLRPWDLGNLTTRIMSEVTPEIRNYAKNHPDKPVPDGESFNDFRRRAFDGFAAALRRNTSRKLLIVAHHRIERLIAGWQANKQPIEHTIDIPTFLEKGDPPGAVIEIKTHRQLLDGGLDEKLTHMQADYREGHGREFCKTCRYSDHQSAPHCVWVDHIEKRGYCRLWAIFKNE
jgi:broad specificity phosphatase PhoE